MSFKKLQEFIDIAKEAGASELEYQDGDKKFSIAFPGSNQVVTPQAHVAVAPQVTAVTEVAKNDNFKEITSPFVGTFYGSPSPDEAAYVKVGDKVSKGQVLCIVEAMKIMNEIESEVSGEIVEICVENENYVEYGQALFKIK
jgi:acetyl-CoA carboxylase biotin carboxyl carrier protein